MKELKNATIDGDQRATMLRSFFSFCRLPRDLDHQSKKTTTQRTPFPPPFREIYAGRTES